MQHYLRIALLLLLGLGSSMAHANRYVTAAPVPTPDQTNPLQVVVTVHLPSDIQTVRDALNYLLTRSGYQLAAATQATDPELPILMSRPIPDVQRQIGPVRLDRALEMLAGKPWHLVLDPVHRLVSFELASSYRVAEAATSAASGHASATSTDSPIRNLAATVQGAAGTIMSAGSGAATGGKAAAAGFRMWEIDPKLGLEANLRKWCDQAVPKCFIKWQLPNDIAMDAPARFYGNVETAIEHTVESLDHTAGFTVGSEAHPNNVIRIFLAR